MNVGKATAIFKNIHNEETGAKTCKHSTGQIGQLAVYVLPTCPNMHIIKGKYVTAKTNCKDCRFCEERK